jgi:hypothetical protein
LATITCPSSRFYRQLPEHWTNLNRSMSALACLPANRCPFTFRCCGVVGFRRGSCRQRNPCTSLSRRRRDRRALLESLICAVEYIDSIRF